MTATSQTSSNTTTKKNAADFDTPPATDRVSKAAHEAIDSIKEPVGDAERKIRDIGSRAEQQVREKKEAARSRTEALLADARDYAHREPLAAAGIAFAAGLLASRLLRS